MIQQYLRNNGDEFYVTVTATIMRFQFVTIKLLYPNGNIIFNILFSIKYAVKSGGGSKGQIFFYQAKNRQKKK